MEAMLEKLELSKDTSKLLNQFIKKVHLNKGKQYQILLETGESVTIAVLAQGKIEEPDLTTEQMVASMAKNDRELRDEPRGLYTLDDIKEKI